MKSWRPGWVAVAALLAGVLPRAGTAEAPGRWTTAAPLPEERTEVAAAEVGGRIYVVGGLGGTQALLEYDPVSDRWRQRARVPQPLHHTAAASVGGRLYVLGGYTPGWTPVDTVFEYDPTTNQ